MPSAYNSLSISELEQKVGGFNLPCSFFKQRNIDKYKISQYSRMVQSKPDCTLRINDYLFDKAGNLVRRAAGNAGLAILQPIVEEMFAEFPG
jgi:hypothetical protein